jgi:hypothetical protein
MGAQSAAPGVQLDAFGTGGRARGVARTLLAQLDQLARFHDSQHHFAAVISVTERQAKQLTKSLKLSGGPMRWHGHPVRIVADL